MPTQRDPSQHHDEASISASIELSCRCLTAFSLYNERFDHRFGYWFAFFLPY